MKSLLMALGLIFSATLLGAPAIAADSQSPSELIKVKATNLLDSVASQREKFKNNPDELYALVKEKLLPVFDFEFTSRLVLGRHWRAASDAERQAFKDAFLDFLVHNYANGLLKYQNNKIDFMPVRGDADRRHTIVQTKVYLDDGTAVPVDYVLHKTGDSWKIFDVIIEGISYVNNYRQQFGSEIDQKGMDALIQRLKNESLEAAQRAKKGDLSVEKPASTG